MRLPGLTCRGVPFIGVGAVGLAVALSLFVQCRLTRDGEQTPRSLQASSGGDAETKDHVCLKKGPSAAARKSSEETKGELELSATKGVPLEFRCDEGLVLRPELEQNVFKYNAAAPRTCVTDKAVTLSTELSGAELIKKETVEGDSRKSTGPVYVFKYSTEPSDDKHLCYTCVTATSPGPVPETVNRSKDSQGTVECTVYITVPKKKEEQTSSSSTTKSPDSPSGARPMPAAVATAAGGFLAAMMLRT